MSSDVAIRVTDVSKHYLMYERPEDRLKQMIVPRLQRAVGRPPRRYFQDFAALGGVSFDVRRGETIGIIGRNGCGKSTLLQIVCGTLQPSSGSVEVNGRVAALLELGAGFNPEFTGRENVYLNAAILGLSRAETDARFDDIARFADIGMFIEQPVKTYSSGMYVRLAFAVAINVDPDILVVDEALAVGDEAFQRKCFARIEAIKDKGGTILFVSHGAQTIVQLCDRAMLIDRGEKILEGRPKTVVSQYQRFVNLSGPDAEPVREEIKAMDGWAERAQDTTAPSARQEDVGDAAMVTAPETSVVSDIDDDSWFDPNLVSQSRVEHESKGARIHNVRITALSGKPVNVLRMGRDYALNFSVDFTTKAQYVILNSAFRTPSGVLITGSSSHPYGLREGFSVERGTTIEAKFVFRCYFLPGTYFGNVRSVGRIDGEEAIMHRIADAFVFRVLPEERVQALGLVDANIRFTSEVRLLQHQS